jgi:hypothetical protein
MSSPIDMQLVERIKTRRKSDRIYAATLDSLGKCVEMGTAHWLDQGQRVAILTAALMAVETDHEGAYEAVLGQEFVPVAAAISDGVKFNRRMFTQALDVLAANVGCRDIEDFQAQSKKTGNRQLWWKLHGGCILICVGAGVVIAVLLWWFGICGLVL